MTRHTWVTRECALSCLSSQSCVVTLIPCTHRTAQDARVFVSSHPCVEWAFPLTSLISSSLSSSSHPSKLVVRTLCYFAKEMESTDESFSNTWAQNQAFSGRTRNSEACPRKDDWQVQTWFSCRTRDSVACHWKELEKRTDFAELRITRHAGTSSSAKRCLVEGEADFDLDVTNFVSICKKIWSRTMVISWSWFRAKVVFDQWR